MNLPLELSALLEEWSGLSVSEETAIRSRDWEALAQFQAAKEALQTRIDAFPDNDRWLRSRPGQEWLGRLIAQERENAASLAVQRQASESMRLEGQSARRHLRQIHEAYGSRQQTRWQSYS